MDCLGSILACVAGHQPTEQTRNSEKTVVVDQQPYSDDAAMQFIEVLRTAECSGKELEERLKSVVSTNNFTERLAERILQGIEKLLKESAKMASAMEQAVKNATNLALEFAEDHPYYTGLIAAGTIIALGVLVLMAPWVLEALGFGLRGPRLGSFAANWMARIARSEGNVSKGSIYAYLQRLGMIWKK